MMKLIHPLLFPIVLVLFSLYSPGLAFHSSSSSSFRHAVALGRSRGLTIRSAPHRHCKDKEVLRLYQSRSDNKNSDGGGGAAALKFLNSQSFTYGIGSLGLLVVFGNRLSILSEAVSDFQSRVDLIVVFACSALILNALTVEEIQTKERDSVALVGYSCTSSILNPKIDATTSAGKTCAWLCETIMFRVSFSISSVHIIKSNQILARVGVLGNGDDRKNGVIEPGKILKKAMAEKVVKRTQHNKIILIINHCVAISTYHNNSK
jgi:hypothetical protein